MRTHTSLRAGILVLSAISLAACASATTGRTEGPTNQVELIVNNNLLASSDLTVYAVTWDGHRTLLGSVPPTETRTLSFKPVSFSERYRLLATRIRGRDIRSETFTVGSDMTGKITWSMVPNLISLRGADADTSGASGATQ